MDTNAVRIDLLEKRVAELEEAVKPREQNKHTWGRVYACLTCQNERNEALKQASECSRQSDGASPGSFTAN